jgi:hypothetical protein
VLMLSVDIGDVVDVNNAVVDDTVVTVNEFNVDVDVVDKRGRLEHLQMGKSSSRVHSLYLK